MRCICFGDLHSHRFKDFAKTDDVTGNTRFTAILDVLDEMRGYCLDNGIKNVLFAGDLFHARKSIETSVINHVFRKINKFAFDGIHVYLLVGNHDQVDNSRFPEHSLEIFKGIDNITVLDRFTPIKVENAYIFPLPFSKDTEYVKEIIDEYVLETERMEEGFKSILLGHLGISGAKTGTNNHIMQDAYTVPELRPDVFNYGVFGHFHKPQFLTERYAYTGSTLQHNFGDSGNKSGFIYIDTDKDIMEAVEVQSPKFVTVTSIEELEGHENDYVNIQIKKEALDTVKEQLDEMEVNCKIDVIREYKNDSRIDVNTSMTEKQVIETYCKDKQREDTVKTLLDIIKEVN